MNVNILLDRIASDGHTLLYNIANLNVRVDRSACAKHTTHAIRVHDSSLFEYRTAQAV